MNSAFFSNASFNNNNADKNGHGGGYLNNSTGLSTAVSMTASNFNNNDNFGLYVTTSGNTICLLD